MTTGISKRSQHLPARAAPLTWNHIKTIVTFLDSTPGVPAAVKPCILIGYHTFLRSSNLLSPTMSCWGGAHTLSTCDLVLHDDGLEISVRSTKTKSDPAPVKTLISWGSDPVTCPAAAWFKYAFKIKPSTLGPAFLTDDYLPLTARHVVGFICWLLWISRILYLPRFLCTLSEEEQFSWQLLKACLFRLSKSVECGVPILESPLTSSNLHI